MLQTTGVYQFLNLINRKRYIGSSMRCVFGRGLEHVKSLRKNEHYNNQFQKAWAKHGEDAFVFEVLEIIQFNSSTKSQRSRILQVELREQHFIDRVPHCLLYNICLVAGSRFGTTMSETAKKKIGDHFRGKNLTECHKDNISKAHKEQGLGRTLSKITREKMSIARKGIKRNEVFRQKVSEGKTDVLFSVTHRSNLSAWQKGLRRGPGKPVSEENKEKIRETKRNPLSDMAIKSIVELRLNGLTYKKIGTRLNVHPYRVGRVCRKKMI